MQMLSGKGDGGGGGRQGGGRPASDEHNSAPSYDEPAFNPDDDIPF
jgi:single-strand DNA-binding protein